MDYILSDAVGGGTESNTETGTRPEKKVGDNDSKLSAGARDSTPSEPSIKSAEAVSDAFSNVDVFLKITRGKGVSTPVDILGQVLDKPDENVCDVIESVSNVGIDAAKGQIARQIGLECCLSVGITAGSLGPVSATLGCVTGFVACSTATITFMSAVEKHSNVSINGACLSVSDQARSISQQVNEGRADMKRSLCTFLSSPAASIGNHQYSTALYLSCMGN
jgi:hypothetical protein